MSEWGDDPWHVAQEAPKPKVIGSRPAPVVRRPVTEKPQRISQNLTLKVGQLVKFMHLGRERGGIIRYFSGDDVVLDIEPAPRTAPVGAYMGIPVQRRNIVSVIRERAPETQV
jgi:hypothetical protein